MTVGIIGYGHFGKLVHTLAGRFAQDARVLVYSSRADRSRVFFAPFEEVAACDIVIPCVPIHALEETLARLAPLMRKDAVLIDVATVKVHTVGLLKRLMPGKRWIATHPMFGPESYTKRGGNVTGLRIVVTESTLAPAERAAAMSLLRSFGFDVIEMTAEEHDKHLAETLFLTHFIGQAVLRGKFNRTDIDTVSFEYLMDAVESVRHDEKLFQDVYRYNPFCEEVLRRFEAAEGEVHSLLARTSSKGDKKE